ncbi:MAG: 2-hydroxychromene-2-carboxylate isomerase [Proteobacteria bacterium]|nr:2-hydroxychromene-2-carboxylate isomerase [Pseudomonadota bacterium]
MPKFEFHFDFGSPNAYLCHKVLPGVVARTGIACDYLPVLLGGVFKLTNNKSPMVQFQGIKNKNEYGALEMERFVRKHGLTKFSRNPHFPVNTVQIMRGAIVAQRTGRLDEYVDAVYLHMWEEPKKMDDPDVIAAALNQSGFDGTAILAAIQEQSVKDELLNNTAASVARGTFGSPTFFVGDEIFFGKDRLADVEAEIERQK